MTGARTHAGVVWTPSRERLAASELVRYQSWLAQHRKLYASDDYDDLWAWSVNNVEAFWQSIWDYFQVRASTPYAWVLGRREMPGAEWFVGARLNYAEHALAWTDEHPAVVFTNECGEEVELSYAELREQVASVAGWLRDVGIKPGDRVAAVLPNIPETIVAFLGCASVGAVWSVCSPDFGVSSIVDRFGQLEPKVLIAADGYTYAGGTFDRRDAIGELRAALPTLEQTVLVPYLDKTATIPGTTSWAAVAATPPRPLEFAQLPFEHPLWILYSSGTTGLPKGIVHGHGGILLEQLRSHALHLDLGREDRVMWFASTGWAVWNIVVGGLLRGCTLLLYDGSPGRPDLLTLWRIAAHQRATLLGMSPPFVQTCMKDGLRPRDNVDLSGLRTFGCTGAPLPAEAYAWIYAHVSDDVLIASLSGGTDVCSAFVGPVPTLPVRAGEMQRRWLGCAVEAWDPDGMPLSDEVGELVVTQPLPSMPTKLWGDADNSRYRAAYFEPWPGVWRHGDWLRITPDGGAVISGRSDTTLKRAGVRIGSAEIYRVVDALPGIADSVAVDTSHAGADGKLVLLVVPASGNTIDQLRGQITAAVREHLSPRHVPDEIHAIDALPRTLNGKKLELPVKRILLGESPDRVASLGSLMNPDALDAIAELARERQARR